MKISVILTELSDKEHLSVSIKAPSAVTGKLEDYPPQFLGGRGAGTPDDDSSVDERFFNFLMGQFRSELIPRAKAAE